MGVDELYGDPDSVRGLARSLRSEVSTIKTGAENHSNRVSDLQWESTAAEAYKSLGQRNAARLNENAKALEGVAQLLDEHAATMEAVIRFIHEVESQIRNWFVAKINAAQDFVEQAIDTAGQVVDSVLHGKPIWEIEEWPWTPATLPPSGDIRWLEVVTFFQAKGHQ